MIDQLRKLAAALRDEAVCLRLCCGFLSWRVWLVLGVLLVTALAAPWLGLAATPLSVAVVLLVGLAMVFSARVSAWGRKRGWLPDHAPIVVAFLPQLLTLLLLPVFLIGLTGLFIALARQFPETLPAEGVVGSLLLTADVVLQAAVFFDLFEVFHLRPADDPSEWTGSVLLFAARLMLDIALIELLARTLYAAMYRVRGLGRGEDKLFRLKEALDAEDAAETRSMAESVGGSLRLAVDALSRRVIDNENEHELAWQGVVRMKEFSLPYLEEQLLSAAGVEREQLQTLADRLHAADPEAESRWNVRRWPLVVLGLTLLATAAAVVVYPPLGLAAAPVLGWMLLTGRAWVNRLVRWHALRPPSPKGFPLVLLAWSAAVAASLVVAFASGAAALAQWFPDLFGVEPGTAGWGDGFGFVAGNLLSTQMFFDLFGPLGLRLTHLEPTGFWGGFLTLAVRLTFDATLIGLVVSFVVVWFNRVFRRFAITPNAELNLREEALECDEQSPRLIGHYYREIKTFLLDALKKYDGTPLLAPLACCGFYPEHRAGRATADVTDETLAAYRLQVGMQLWTWDRLLDAEADLLEAAAIYTKLVEEGRIELRWPLARALRTLACLLDAQQRVAEACEMKSAALAEFRRLEAEAGSEDVAALVELRVEFWALLSSEEVVEDLRKAIAWLESDFRGTERQRRIELARLRSYLALQLNNLNRLDDAEHEGGWVVNEVEVGRLAAEDVLNPLATCHLTLALVHTMRVELSQAEERYRKASQVYKTMAQLGLDNAAGSFVSVGQGLQMGLTLQGKLDEAERAGRETLEVMEGLVRGGRLELRPTLAAARMAFAMSILEWKPAVAESQARQAAELYERLLKEDPARDLRGPLAGTYTLVASVLNLQGRPDEGGAVARKALADIRRWVAAGQAPLPQHEVGLLHELATSHLFSQRPARAERSYRDALAVFDRLPPELAAGQEQTQARIETGLVEALLVQGRLPEAEAMLDQLAATLEPLVHGGRAEMRCDLAGVHLLRGLTWLRQGRAAEGRAELLTSQGLFRTLFEEGQTQQLRFALLLLEAVLPAKPLYPTLTAAAFEVMGPLLEEYLPRKIHWPEPARAAAQRFFQRAALAPLSPEVGERGH